MVKGVIVGLATGLVLLIGSPVLANAVAQPGEDDCDGQDLSAMAAPGDALRVMTYNIRYGVPMGADPNAPGTDDIDGTIAAIREQDADVVGLQEVHYNDVWHGDQPDVIAEQLADVYPYTRYHTNSVSGGEHAGEGGNMLLSKYPILDETHLLLPTGEHSRRGLHGLQVDVNGTPVWVYTTHLTAGYDDPAVVQRRAETTTILDSLASPTEPVVFMGDLNMRPYEAPISWIANDGWVDAWTTTYRNDAGCTYPANEPAIGRVDYVYSSPGLEIVAGSVPTPQASDHRPVVLDFSLPEQDVDRVVGILAGAEGLSGTANLATYTDGGAKLGVCDTNPDGWAVEATVLDPSSGAELATQADPASGDPCYSTTAQLDQTDSLAIRTCLVMSGEPDRDCRTKNLAVRRD